MIGSTTLRPNGEILITVHEYIGGGWHLEYAWEGGPIVSVSCELQRQSPYVIRHEGNLLQIGPYRLRIVEEKYCGGPVMQHMVCVREGPYAWALTAYTRLYNLSTYVRGGIIVTLATWGLADCHEAMIPRLGDIHFVQWLLAHRKKAA